MERKLIASLGLVFLDLLADRLSTYMKGDSTDDAEQPQRPETQTRVESCADTAFEGVGEPEVREHPSTGSSFGKGVVAGAILAVVILGAIGIAIRED